MDNIGWILPCAKCAPSGPQTPKAPIEAWLRERLASALRERRDAGTDDARTLAVRINELRLILRRLRR